MAEEIDGINVAAIAKGLDGELTHEKTDRISQSIVESLVFCQSKSSVKFQKKG